MSEKNNLMKLFQPKWKSPMDGPERDYVNWPRRQRPIERPPVRLKMFPEEWFTALHSKTGATGTARKRKP